MPSSWTQNFYHAIYSTKDRLELITPDLEVRLYPFIAGILKDLGCTTYGIDGMPDHVHALVRYPSDLSHAKMLRHMKARSSLWIHEEFPQLKSFAWQLGYGGFTVSKSQVQKVERYIRSQKQRHKKQTYRDEVVELFRLNGMKLVEEDVFR